MLIDPADHRHNVATRYERVATEYDELWAPVLFGRVRDVVARLDLAAAERVVDVGCGTGTGLRLLSEVAPHATVVGVDLTHGMLQAARATFAGPLAAMDGQQLALRDSCADAIVCTFALHHIADPAAALRDWARVLSPGGAVGLAGWGIAEATAAESVWDEELDDAGAPPVAINPRMDTDFDSPLKMARLLESTGFVDVDTWAVPLGHTWTPEGLLEHLTRYAATRDRLAALTYRNRVLERIRARFARLPSTAFDEPGECVLAIAHRPDAARP